jgi:hypothetical protein
VKWQQQLLGKTLTEVWHSRCRRDVYEGHSKERQRNWGQLRIPSAVPLCFMLVGLAACSAAWAAYVCAGYVTLQAVELSAAPLLIVHDGSVCTAGALRLTCRACHTAYIKRMCGSEDCSTSSVYEVRGEQSAGTAAAGSGAPL